GTEANMVPFARGEVFEFAFPFDTENGLEVVLVPHSRFHAAVEDGFVEGESHAVFLEQIAAANPRGCMYFTFRSRQIFAASNNHELASKKTVVVVTATDQW